LLSCAFVSTEFLRKGTAAKNRYSSSVTRTESAVPIVKMVVDSSCKVLRRLQCLNDCAKAILESAPVPECVCYVPEEVEYKPKRSTSLAVYTKPSKTGGKKSQLLCTSKHRIFLSVAGPVRNEKGNWAKVKKVSQ